MNAVLKTQIPLNVRCHNIAIYHSAFAVLARLVDSDNHVLDLTVVPGANALQEPRFTWAQSEALSSPSDFENSITVHMAGLAAVSLMQDHGEGVRDLTVSQAHHLAVKLADLTMSDWRTSRPQLVGEIKGRCYLRAHELVTTHRDRIQKAAAVTGKTTLPVAEEFIVL